MIIKVKVIPNSSINRIEISEDGNYKVKVKSVPLKGKANAEVISLLAKHFNVSENNVKIKNPTSRLKLVEIL